MFTFLLFEYSLPWKVTLSSTVYVSTLIGARVKRMHCKFRSIFTLRIFISAYLGFGEYAPFFFEKFS